MYATGVENAFLNPAIQKNPLTESNFQNLFEKAERFYASHNLPWIWAVRQDLISQDLRRTKSLELLDQSSAMFIDLRNLLTREPSNDLIIKEDNDDLTDWGLSLCQAYQSPLEVSNQYINAKKRQGTSKTTFHHFVGYLNTVPVSCLTLSIQEDRARIDDVGTIPEHQNKGYATQMIVDALQTAMALGANFCFLEASQLGIGIYEKLGFQNIFSNLYFKAQKYV